MVESPNKETAMRQQFVACETREEAEKTCPWAAEIIEVEGGYRCFESVQDAKIWQVQT
jgi:hypothetical protein